MPLYKSTLTKTVKVSISLSIALALGSCLGAGTAQLDTELLRKAEKEFNQRKYSLSKRRYITIIDYRRSILQTRLWVYDRTTHKTVLQSRVSHAFNSGFFTPSSFSNVEGSNMSCIGSFVTLEPYMGRFGYSMRLNGVTPGVNDNAKSRAIVFHPGLTYSNGCFMTDSKTNKKLIHLIASGSLVYVTR